MSYGYNDTGWVEMDMYPDDEAFEIFDALVEVTGYDSFALAGDMYGLEARFGDDYENVVTQDMLEKAGHIANYQWWYVRDVLLDRLCEHVL